MSSLDISYGTIANAAPKTLPGLTPIHCDISSEESVRDAFAEATKSNGNVEVCIALASLDASVLESSPFVDTSLAQLKRVLDVNVAGTWITAREWLRGVRQAKSEGRILNNVNLILVGSESGHFGARQKVDYSLGKSAVQGGLLAILRGEVVREWFWGSM